MSDRLAAMETFVRVVDGGSFSAAAKSTGVSQPHVSKIVAGLEKRLGARLLNRTTRHITATEAGLAFYERCKAALTAIDDAETEARIGQGAIRGLLRINTSAMAGSALVLPAILAFRESHPGVRIEVAVDDRRIDPVQEGVDLIVRSGQLTDSTLVARRAGFAPLVLVAAPAYLVGRPAPATVKDLEDHAVVLIGRNRGPFDLRSPDRSGAIHTARIDGPVAVGNALLARDACLAGAGIAFLPRFFGDDLIAAGRLVEILPDFTMPRLEINLVHPFGRAPPRKVGAFIDLAIALWRREGWVEE
ncbi:MAG: LysR family transcriptional regulator [Bauldia sp.]|nr:LysR family transcriptional regulator [Bauldia sp.]